MSHNPPKKILFFDHTAAMGGGEISLLHLIQHLDQTRFRPIVLLSTDGTLRQKLESSGIETHILPLASDVLDTRKDSLGRRSLLRLGAIFKTLAYIGRVAQFIKQQRPAVLHTNSLKSDIIGGVAGRLVGVPVIWHVRDRIAEDYLPRRVVRAFRWLCRVLPDYIITNSAATFDTLNLPRQGQARVIYNGIVEKNASVVHDGALPFKAFAMIDHSQTPYIGLVGRITPWKGQHIFINAAA